MSESNTCKVKKYKSKERQDQTPLLDTILCLGHVAGFYSQPMLELENWAKAKPLEDFLSENE